LNVSILLLTLGSSATDHPDVFLAMKLGEEAGEVSRRREEHKGLPFLHTLRVVAELGFLLFVLNILNESFSSAHSESGDEGCGNASENRILTAHGLDCCGQRAGEKGSLRSRDETLNEWALLKDRVLFQASSNESSVVWGDH
jgi:hypothetical protein